MTSKSLFRLSLCFAALSVAAPGAIAQETPDSSPPPASAPAPAPAPAPPATGVQGPPDGLIVPPGPGQQRPLPPIILPAPAPAPAPAPEPAPNRPPEREGRPAPSAREPETARAAPPRETAPATAAPAADAVPADPAPRPALPDAGIDPQTPAASTHDAPPVPPTVSTEADGSLLPEWSPLVFIVFVGGLLAGGTVWWRRRRHALAGEAVSEHEAQLTMPQPESSAEPEPVPAAPDIPAPQLPPAAPPKPARFGRRADLAITFEPLSAQSTLVNLRLRYAVTVRNGGAIAAAPVAVRIGLFAGAAAHPQGIAQWFTLDGQPAHHTVPDIPAGGEYRFEGELAAPLDALGPITVEGRVLVVPLVAVDARYGHAAGEAPIEGQYARAFVVGREPASEGARLSPFRLDRGPASFGPLGVRDTGIGRVA